MTPPCKQNKAVVHAITLPLQMKVATQCLACDGVGYLRCQVCMGEQRLHAGPGVAELTLVETPHANMWACNALYQSPATCCLLYHLFPPVLCRQGNSSLPTTRPDAAAAAPEAPGGRRPQQSSRDVLVPRMRHDADAALPQLRGGRQAVFAKLASSRFAAFQAALPWMWQGYVCMYSCCREQPECHTTSVLSRELLMYM